MRIGGKGIKDWGRGESSENERRGFEGGMNQGNKFWDYAYI